MKYSPPSVVGCRDEGSAMNPCCSSKVPKLSSPATICCTSPPVLLTRRLMDVSSVV